MPKKDAKKGKAEAALLDTLNTLRARELAVIEQYMRHHYIVTGPEGVALADEFKEVAFTAMKQAEEVDAPGLRLGVLLLGERVLLELVREGDALGTVHDVVVAHVLLDHCELTRAKRVEGVEQRRLGLPLLRVLLRHAITSFPCRRACRPRFRPPVRSRATGRTPRRAARSSPPPCGCRG